MLDRRGFLKFIGGAAAGTLATPVIWRGLDDISIWSQNWSWIPSPAKGRETWTKTVSKTCPTACGMRIRSINGQPVHVSGDKDSPLSFGAVSALASAEVRLLHSPARVRTPLLKNGDGSFSPISWEKALKMLTGICKQLQKNEACFISGDTNGLLNEIYAGFLCKIGSDRFYVMPDDAHSLTQAWKSAGGNGRLGFDMAESDFILALNADILDSWGTAPATARQKKDSTRIAWAGSAGTGTAAVADVKLFINPGTETALLMGLIHMLAAEDHLCSFKNVRRLSEAASQWTTAKVCEATGLSQDIFLSFAKAFLSAKSPLVVAGTSLQQGGRTPMFAAAIALNMALGQLNKKGGMRAVPVPDPIVSESPAYTEIFSRNLIDDLRKSAASPKESPRLLIFYAANPIYALPLPETSAAIQRADLSVAFSPFLDETAQECKLVLPLAEGLEREDCVAFPLGYPFSLFSIAQPASDPLFESRSAADVLMDIAKRLGSPFSFASVREFLAAGAAAVGASPDQVFAGKAFVSQAVVNVYPFYDVPLISRDPVFNRNPGGLKLIPIWKNAFGTPSSGLPPSNTVLTGEFLKEGLSVVSMNRASAVSLGLHEGSHVTIAAGGKTVRAVVSLSENIASNTAVAASGFGHEGFAGYNRGKGNNILTLIAACADSSPEFSADGGIDIQIRSKD
ncbi:MAG: molybdopterin-dependent oxidoreductase [Desulfovibrionaceae bacterium]|nr:molybdopterin-dependent oxidoreductase [Desulfovibrionaceae bacterium]